MKKFGLPRSRRLLHKGAYVRVQTSGRKIITRNFLFLFHQNDTGATRLGLAVSKKVGVAVVRNRVRRVIREVFRQQKPLEDASLDLVVIPRRNLQHPVSFETVWQNFEELSAKYASGRSLPAGRPGR